MSDLFTRAVVALEVIGAALTRTAAAQEAALTGEDLPEGAAGTDPAKRGRGRPRKETTVTAPPVGESVPAGAASASAAASTAAAAAAGSAPASNATPAAGASAASEIDVKVIQGRVIALIQAGKKDEAVKALTSKIPTGTAPSASGLPAADRQWFLDETAKHLPAKA